MEFASLGSGSSGNGTLIKSADATVLIDCGFTGKEAEHRLALRHTDPQELDAILLTHEHGDHVQGVSVLARRNNIPVYASSGTFEALARRNNRLVDSVELIHEIRGGIAFDVKSLTVYPIEVPHDVNEPTQYVCRADGIGVGVLTDCGSYTEQMVTHYSELNGLLLEANHDVEMLENGPYPWRLKDRINSAYGHLNNQQSRGFAQAIHHPNLQHLVLGHISEQNNDKALIKDLFDDYPSGTSVSFASQSEGTDWYRVTGGDA